MIGSHKVVGKGYVNTENSQMASIGAIFTSTYHTKQLHLWPNSSPSRMVNYSQLSACQEEREPFKDHQITCGMSDKLQKQATAKAA